MFPKLMYQYFLFRHDKCFFIRIKKLKKLNRKSETRCSPSGAVHISFSTSEMQCLVCRYGTAAKRSNKN